MTYPPICLPGNGKLPKDLRHDTQCYGAIEPKYGRRIEVAGPEGTKMKERLFFLLDVFDTIPLHPVDFDGNCLPRRFRVINPLFPCTKIDEREAHFSKTTSIECIKQCGNVALAASGAFSKNQFINAVVQLKKLYGNDVTITIIDGREELHWLGDLEDDGEPFSQHTMTNHQNSGMTKDQILDEERKFAAFKTIKIWARKKDDELSPVFREYQNIQTEEQFVTSFNHISYVRLPVTDHTALSLDSVLTLDRIVQNTIQKASKPDAPVHVIWTHCFGGKGRASSLSFATHVMLQRYMASRGIPFEMPDYKTLTTHIWLSGGSKLDSKPDPEKKYKYNGAICRTGIMKQLYASYSKSGTEMELRSRVEELYTDFVEKHQKEWNTQVDPTDFAEEDADDENDLIL
jgi:hypothetical protein